MNKYTRTLVKYYLRSGASIIVYKYTNVWGSSSWSSLDFIPIYCPDYEAEEPFEEKIIYTDRKME